MKKTLGFTLVELMITLAVGVIILGIGIPALNGLMSSNRTSGYANELIGALRLARSEAVKRGEGVTICPSNGENDAATIVCSGSDWQNGWLVFADPDDDRTYTEGTDTLFRIWQAPEGGASFDQAPESIRFLASGERSGAVNDFSFQLENCSGNQARTISISNMGRTQVTHSTCL